jgi:ketosteroid isomerase-like protein
MSKRNVELLRQVIGAVNRQDVEGFVQIFDRKAEGTSVITGPFGTVYHGHDGMRRYFRDLNEAWGDDFYIEVEALFDLDEHTLSFYVFKGRGQQSGAEVAMPGAVIARWRDGLIVSFTGYVRREDALRDLGVTEDELEPIAP